MKRLACLALVAVVACGGKPSTSSTSNTTPEGPAGGGPKLPWEAALTVGASFTLGVDDEMGAEGGEYPDVTIKVTDVEDKGSERVYTLDWGEHGGPSKIVVRGATVLVGDAEPAAMQEPWEIPGGILCYAEDFSNPCGCEDVCDASLCFAGESGIVMASGLYTPGYMPYSAK